MAASRMMAHPPSLNRQSLPSDSSPPSLSLNLKPHSKRHRNSVTIRASLLRGHNKDNDIDETLQQQQQQLHRLELRTTTSHHSTNHEDLLALPRPLSSTQFSDSFSDGPRLRVAYQGVSGAYSESAAKKAYPNCEAVPCDQFDTAFQAVERRVVDRAVLPIENSLGGSIHRNYDLLLRHSLHIVGEVKYAVRHCLLANHGVKLEDLKQVLSHPQALAQCENTLTRLGLVREAVDDTAGAAKYVALHKIQDAGAVASSAAAKIYGLNILAEDIQDVSDNVTRFLMLAREPIIPGTDRPFKIESRPLRKQPLRASDDNKNVKYFDYHFCVDFEASMADQNAQNALGHLEEFATFMRVLGSYPVDTSML